MFHLNDPNKDQWPVYHSEYSTSKDSMNQPWERIHQFTWCTIAWFQIERCWIWVSLSWAKQHETYIVRKTELATFSSLVFIGPILNNINRCTDNVTGNPYMYISYKSDFQVYRQLYLAQYWPDRHHTFITSMCFFWPCGSRVVYPIINRLIPSPSRFETRQWPSDLWPGSSQRNSFLVHTGCTCSVCHAGYLFLTIFFLED